MEIIKYIVICVSGYVFGSVNFSILISRLIHKSDIRRKGSGNAGATNMARSYGLAAGIEALIGDMMKTSLALLDGYFISGSIGMCISGFFCIIGHCYPVFYDFKGGKGVAVACVIVAFICPELLLVCVPVFLIVVGLSRKVSLGSILASAVLLAGMFLKKSPVEVFSLGVFTALIILFRHKDNIQRLIKGTEPDFALPKRKKK